MWDSSDYIEAMEGNVVYTVEYICCHNCEVDIPPGAEYMASTESSDILCCQCYYFLSRNTEGSEEDEAYFSSFYPAINEVGS